MSTTKSDTDPTMAANATTAKTQGKLSDYEIEYFLRDIEEKGLDPFFMSTKIQVWDKNQDMYGKAGTSKRAQFSRYLGNVIRKKNWKGYVDLLEEKGVDMSDLTESKLAEELEKNGGPNDVAISDARAVACAVLDSANKKNATLNPVVSFYDYSMGIEDITQKFNNATKITGPPTQAAPIQVPTAHSPAFGSPFGSHPSPFSSPAIQHRLSFDEPSSVVNYALADYIHDGSVEKPTPIYFNDKRPFQHGGLFIHQADVPHNHQVIKTTVVQKSGSIGDINHMSLEVAHSVPPCFQAYIGRALLFREPATECFGRNIDPFIKRSLTDPSMQQTATELKKAQVAATKGNNAWTFKLVLFPLSQEPFDNRVFSSDDIRVNRVTIPNMMVEQTSQKDLFGFTSTWKIAHAGKIEDIEMRDDNKVDLSSFF